MSMKQDRSSHVAIRVQNVGKPELQALIKKIESSEGVKQVLLFEPLVRAPSFELFKGAVGRLQRMASRAKFPR